MSKNKFIVVFFIICSLQISCGFNLRKPISVNYESYSIIGDKSAITQNIKRQFSYGAIVEEKNGNGELVIEILENNFTKRILSLAGNGQVGEFELIQTLSYRIKSKDKWSDARKLEAIREYTFDPTLYNAAAAEESILKDTMIEQISRSIINEINNLDK
jgi:outer membrane lipopolysaccharide assembly protein LptE/RlpB